jgi:EmrB/QacA subfamily drug resistance transporter
MKSKKWAVFGVVAIGVFMGTLDTSIVNISLPSIARNFAVPLNGGIEWVVIGYLVSSAAFLLSSGRLSDLVGRKVIWTAGLAIFTASSALCGAAPSLWFLVAARFLQGLGGALLFSTSPALLTSAFPPEQRGRALGLNAVTVALGTSAGPTLGGLITSSLSWRWIFLINLPIGIIGIVLTLVLLEETPRKEKVKFDPLGAVLLGSGLASLVGALSFAQELGIGSPWIIASTAYGLVALAVLPWWEGRAKSPLIDFSLLGDRVFLSANLSLILSFLALFAVNFLMPFYFEQLRGFPTAMAGLLLTPLPICIALIAPVSGSIADRTGSTRWLAASGLAIACLGLALLGFLDAHSSVPDIVARLLLVGLGQAIFQSPNNSALLGSVPPSSRGVASGFMATGRVIGQSMSVAIAGAVFGMLGGARAGAALDSGGAGKEAMQASFLLGFRTAFLVCAAIAVVGIAASLVRGREGGAERRRAGSGGGR